MIEKERHFISTHNPIIYGKNYGFHSYTEPIQLYGYVSKVNICINVDFIILPTFEYRDCELVLYDVKVEIMERKEDPGSNTGPYWNVIKIVNKKKKDVVTFDPDTPSGKGVPHSAYVQTSLNMDIVDVVNPAIRIVIDNIRNKNDVPLLKSEEHFQIEVMIFYTTRDTIKLKEGEMIKYDLIDLDKETMPST